MSKKARDRRAYKRVSKRLNTPREKRHDILIHALRWNKEYCQHLWRWDRGRESLCRTLEQDFSLEWHKPYLHKGGKP